MLIEAALGHFDEAFTFAEMSKARTMLEQTAIRTAARSSILTEAEQAKLLSLETESARLDNQIALSTANPAVRAELEARRHETISAFQKLHADLVAKYPNYAAAADVRLVGPSDLAPLIPRDTAILQFITLGPRTVLLWKSGEGESGILNLPPMAGLADTVEVFRAILSKPNGIEGLRYPTAGERRQLVWRLKDGSYRLRPADLGPVSGAELVRDGDEVGDHLSAWLLGSLPIAIKRAPTWIVSPDGPLALLAFDALVEDGHPLVMKRQINSVQSFSMLRLIVDRGKAYEALSRTPLIAIGDPDYSSADPTPLAPPPEKPADAISKITRTTQIAHHKRWKQLPGTARELERMAEIFDLREGISRFSGRSASEQTLKELNRKGTLGQVRSILFAAHGHLDMRDPRRSAIVLSQHSANDEHDGYLTAAELPAYTFRSDLAVLSACDSGVGAWVSGEGVLGLPFALYVAGNRSTILTLWPIYDSGAAEFISRLFQKLRSTVPIGQALVETKREFASGAAGDSYRFPAYWAAFTLVGSPR